MVFQNNGVTRCKGFSANTHFTSNNIGHAFLGWIRSIKHTPCFCQHIEIKHWRIRFNRRNHTKSFPSNKPLHHAFFQKMRQLTLFDVRETGLNLGFFFRQCQPRLNTIEFMLTRFRFNCLALRMHDAFARRHPVDITGHNFKVVS